jgi:very-short-patch-repair endonuclease
MGQPLFGYIVDALFVEEKVIVELDSWPFHKGKIAFEDDRERDAVALTGGFVTVRITEERLEERSDQEAHRLHAVLERRRRGAHAPNAA